MEHLLIQSYPDTWNYMIAGYAVIFVMMFSYILSIGIRRRRTVRKLKEFRKNLD